jgi:hypothetical protein
MHKEAQRGRLPQIHYQQILDNYKQLSVRTGLTPLTLKSTSNPGWILRNIHNSLRLFQNGVKPTDVDKLDSSIPMGFYAETAEQGVNPRFLEHLKNRYDLKLNEAIKDPQDPRVTAAIVHGGLPQAIRALKAGATTSQVEEIANKHKDLESRGWLLNKVDDRYYTKPHLLSLYAEYMQGSKDDLNLEISGHPHSSDRHQAFLDDLEKFGGEPDATRLSFKAKMYAAGAKPESIDEDYQKLSGSAYQTNYLDAVARNGIHHDHWMSVLNNNPTGLKKYFIGRTEYDLSHEEAAKAASDVRPLEQILKQRKTKQFVVPDKNPQKGPQGPPDLSANDLVF